MAQTTPETRVMPEDVYRVTDHLDPVSEAELARLAADLGATLPSGYRNYLRSLGTGSFCGIVEVLAPDEVRSARADAEQHGVLKAAHQTGRTSGRC
jgi:hypothetical protein